MSIFSFGPWRTVGTDQVTDQVIPEVERVLMAVKGEMKRTELQQALGLKHAPHFRDAYLRPALVAVLSNMDAELNALEQRRAKTAALKQAMMQDLFTGRTRLIHD